MGCRAKEFREGGGNRSGLRAGVERSGRGSQKQSKPTEARAAWEKAVQADPKYIKPYIQLTMLDLEEKRRRMRSRLPAKAVAMNPLEFPELYFYYAAANYNLKHLRCGRGQRAPRHGSR
jgi:hypothetical protein